jgi:hypothetical protein
MLLLKQKLNYVGRFNRVTETYMSLRMARLQNINVQLTLPAAVRDDYVK